LTKHWAPAKNAKVIPKASGPLNEGAKGFVAVNLGC
jgi:hypothetical protein